MAKTSKPIASMTPKELLAYTEDLRSRYNERVGKLREQREILSRLENELANTKAELQAANDYNAELAESITELTAENARMREAIVTTSDNTSKLMGIVESELSAEASAFASIVNGVTSRQDVTNDLLRQIVDAMVGNLSLIHI